MVTIMSSDACSKEYRAVTAEMLAQICARSRADQDRNRLSSVANALSTVRAHKLLLFSQNNIVLQCECAIKKTRPVGEDRPYGVVLKKKISVPRPRNPPNPAPALTLGAVTVGTGMTGPGRLWHLATLGRHLQYPVTTVSRYHRPERAAHTSALAHGTSEEDFLTLRRNSLPPGVEPTT
jgi:hypothetical protein